MELTDELKLALFNLVKLKEYKDEKGKDDFYNEYQPKMWQYARQVLKACEGKDDSTSEKDLRVCEVSGSLFSDSQILDWLHVIMSPDSDYCEVFLAGLRDFKQGYATAFQVESNPEKFKTVNAPTLREAISLAMIAYNDR